MNLAVTGTPTFPRLDLVRQFVERLPDDTDLIIGEDHRKLPRPETVDSTIQFYARQRELDFRVCAYNWRVWGRYALSERNREMLKDADMVVVFWWPKMGTYDMIMQAKGMLEREHKHLTPETGQLQIRIVYPDGSVTDGTELVKRRHNTWVHPSQWHTPQTIERVRAVWAP
jgi:hypothetical protein